MKLGYEKKVARRLAKFCYLAMTFTCGLFGLFLREKAPIHLIACSGMHTAGARAVPYRPPLLLYVGDRRSGHGWYVPLLDSAKTAPRTALWNGVMVPGMGPGLSIPFRAGVFDIYR